MSRVKHALKNIKVNLIFYLIYTFVGFFSRKIFLDYLGDEFVGLVGTLQSILRFLNLAELGIGTAIGFALYKPIFDNDREKLNKIVSLLGYLYKRVALIMLGVGIVCSFFFGHFFEETTFSLWLILYCFYAFLFSSLLGYLVNYHQSLLQADQKEYLVTSYLQTSNIIRQIIQACVAYYFQNLYLWVSLELFFSIVYSIIIRRVIKKQYPWLHLNQKASKDILKEFKEIITKVKQVFVHQISTFVTYGTDQLLIYYFVNIQSVAYFGNYFLIFSMIQNIVGKMFTGINAGIGNLIAEDDQKQIEKVFWEMMSLRFFLAGFTTLNIYFLIHSFISIWVGDKYLLDNDIIIFMALNYFVLIARLPIDSFLHAYGLYKDTWAPMVEIVLNLGISLIFGSLWGIKGIVFGTTISVTTILILWKPYYLYTSGFKKSLRKDFWPHFLKLILVFLASAYITHQLKNMVLDYTPVNYWEWFLYAVKLNVIIILVFVPLIYFFGKGFKSLIERIIKRNG